MKITVDSVLFTPAVEEKLLQEVVRTCSAVFEVVQAPLIQGLDRSSSRPSQRYRAEGSGRRAVLIAREVPGVSAGRAPVVPTPSLSSQPQELHAHIENFFLASV